jgi:peptide/nickel transport system substrate-binding protein
MKRWLIATALAATLAATAEARTFRLANDGDVSSMDPHARNETFLLAFNSSIYEPLVRRDKDLKLEGALAVRWTYVTPTLIRFELRPNVKWQDGGAFSADDVVFSLERAAGPGSNMTGYFPSVKEVRKAGDLVVEVETKYPDPVFVDKMAQIGIMSKAWAEKNGA